MEFVIEKGDRFEATATQASSLATIDLILGKLDNEHKEMFKSSCFGQFVEMRRIKFSGHLIHHLLNRLIKCDKEDELWFCFRDKPTRFSLKEWALITGLNCGANQVLESNRLLVPQNNRLLYQYFAGRSHITVKELEDTFAKCQDMSDRYKLGLVLFLESVLLCPDRRASIQLVSLSLVEDLDIFNSCPWGTESFRRTIAMFKRDWRAKSKELKINPKPNRFKYSFHGFPLALQVWAYEALPRVGRKFASKFQYKVPRIVCWDATVSPTSSKISVVLNRRELKVHRIIRPTAEENSKPFMRDFSPSESESHDQRPPGAEAPKESGPHGLTGSSPHKENLGDMKGSPTQGSHITPKFSPGHQCGRSDERPSHVRQTEGGYLTQKEFNQRVSQIKKRFGTVKKKIDGLQSYCGTIEKKIDTVIELLQNSNMSRGCECQSKCDYHNSFKHCGGSQHRSSSEHQSADKDDVGFEHDRPSTSLFDNPMLVVCPSRVQSQYEHANRLIHEQQSMMNVDTTGVYPNSLLYSNGADLFDNEGQEICGQEERQASQNRKRPTYFRSLYSNPLKRKKSEDGHGISPLPVVDPLSSGDLGCWHAQPSQRVDLKLVKCNKKWFRAIQTSCRALIDKKKQKMHPSNRNRDGGQTLRRSQRLLSAKEFSNKAQENINSETRSYSVGSEDHSDIQSDSTSDSAGLCSHYQRAQIPIGPLFQADVPESCGEAYDSDPKWTGTLVWPVERVETKLNMTEEHPPGKGRQESCGCQSPGSVECVRLHVGEKRTMMKLKLGPAYYEWKFYSMGEDVSISWTKEEEYKFQDIVKSTPSFWDELFNVFPCKGRESLVCYYYNVFLLQRRGYQNRTSTVYIDSEDEESEFGPMAAETPGSIFYSPKKFH